MIRFSDVRIKTKLLIVIFLVTFLAVIFSSIWIMLSDLILFKQDLYNNTRTLIKTLSPNFTMPLLLEDTNRANQGLQSFESIRYINEAVLFSASDSSIFASYKREQNKQQPTSLHAIQEGFFDQYLNIIEPVVYRERSSGEETGEYREKLLGYLYVNCEIKEFRERIRAYLLNALLIIGLVLLVSFLLALSIQKIFTRPLSQLSKIAKNISEKGDYSLRVEKRSNDEIGTLYDAFNSMLERVHKRDIERDNIQQKLEHTRNFFQNVINSMPSLLITTDQLGRITQMNEAAEKIFGYHFKHSSPPCFWELSPLFEKYRELCYDVLEKKALRQLMVEPISLDEDLHYFNITLYPFAVDTTLGLVIRFDDVSDAVKKDQQLRQAQKMETIGTLVGGIAHDFNNVLGGIIGTISLLKYRLEQNDGFQKTQILPFLESIDKTSQRAAEMVMQLLALSRKQEFSVKNIDLHESMEHVLNICRSTFDKSVEIKVQYPDEPAIIMGDATQLEQILLNICLNAYHAMTIMRSPEECRGGVLSVYLRKFFADTYFCSLHPEAHEIEYWNLSVHDNGVGMNPETMSKIFDPFFTTKDKDKGTGLGLTMVYNIIAQHKGFNTVWSELGQGTGFNVYLPAADIGLFEEPQEKKYRVTKGKGKIFIIDDEEIIRQVAEEILLECGYSVICATNGDEAIALYKQFYPSIDLVLLDIVMPKKSGKEVFLEMIEINPSARIIVSSGFRYDDRVDFLLNKGAIGFIQKPYTMDQLIETIQSLN